MPRLTGRGGGKRLKELQAKFPLTPEEISIIQRSADAVWGEVAYDALEGNERKTVSKEVVMEIVLDADRLADHLRRGKDLERYPAIAALFPKSWDTDASDYLHYIVGLGFTYRRYGL